MSAETHRKHEFKKHIAFIKLLGVLAITVTTVLVITIATLSIYDKVTCYGYVKSRKKIELLAPENGRLTKLYRKIGDTVAEGDLIAKIDSEELNDSIFRIENEIEKAKAQLRLREAHYRLKQVNPLPNALLSVDAELEKEKKRLETTRYHRDFVQKLFDKKHASSMELRKAELQHEEANAQYAQALQRKTLIDNGLKDAEIYKAEQELEIAKTNLFVLERQLNHLQQKRAACEIRAPRAGTIAQIHPEEGDAIIKNSYVSKLVYGNQKLIRALVSDEDIQEIRVGQETLCYSNHYDYLKVGAFPGVVEHIHAEIDPDSGGYLYPVDIKLIEEPKELRLGSSVKLKILTDNQRLFESLFEFK